MQVTEGEVYDMLVKTRRLFYTLYLKSVSQVVVSVGELLLCFFLETTTLVDYTSQLRAANGFTKNGTG